MNGGISNWIKLSFLGTSAALLVLGGLSFSVCAQKPSPTPGQGTKVETKREKRVDTLVCVGCENPTTPPIPPKTPAAKSPKANPDKKDTIDSLSDVFEKSTTADKKVIIDLCVSEGDISVSGWERSEVRVFIAEGEGAGFRTRKSNSQNQPSVLSVYGVESPEEGGQGVGRCLSGSDIQLDVPIGATIKLKGQESSIEIRVDSVAKVSVRNDEGDVRLTGITEGLDVKTFEGDIYVEDSKGAIDLDTVNGSIVAFGLEPNGDGDIFRVKTHSGSTVIQNVAHSILESSSISGLIRYSGSLQNGGQYSFRSTSGQIVVEMPPDSSCAVQVLSEKGKFSFDVPIEQLKRIPFGTSTQRVTGIMGRGEASLNLTSTTGAIIFRKSR